MALNMKSVVVASLCLSAILIGCGPSNSSSRDQLNDQVRDENSRTQAKNARVVGTYKGTITNPDGVVYKTELFIYSGVFISNPGNSAPIEVPTLVSSLTVFNSGKIPDIESYNFGTFDDNRNVVSLYNAQTNNSQGSPITSSIIVTKNGENLVGEVCGSKCSTINVNLVHKPTKNSAPTNPEMD